MVTRLPGSARGMLRDAIRANTGHAAHINARYPGKKVNDLIRPELITTAKELGIDVPAVLAAAAAKDAAADTTDPVRPAPRPPVVESPAPRQDVGQDGDGDAGDVGQDAGDAGDAGDGDGDAGDVDPEAAIIAEADAIRRTIATGLVEGDFPTVTATITALVREARKPARVITIREAADGSAAPTPPALAPVPKPSGTATRADLFGFKGKSGGDKMNVYAPHPTTPAVDPAYEWPQAATEAVLSAMKRQRNAWLFGPAGTGKSSFAEQLAARTGRPFYLIACDDTTEAPELVGMTTPHNGSVRWQDGVLTAAIRVPHAIILIDEPSVARPGALMVLQSVLASRILSIKETGEMVAVAEGVRFICADNTNGTGGGNAAGYEGTRRLNRATLDRFSAFVAIDYMKPDVEARVLAKRSGCTAELAKILVECAGLTRQARVTHALGLRRLIAWAELLSDGVDARSAFEFAILNSATKDDREPLEQCCALGLRQGDVTAALAGKPAANPLDFGA